MKYIWYSPKKKQIFFLFYTIHRHFAIHKAGGENTIRAVAGQRSSPDLCFATKSIKSMTKDIDLNVTQVGRDGTA